MGSTVTERYTITPPERFTISPPEETDRFTVTPPPSAKPLPYRMLDIMGKGAGAVGEEYTGLSNLFRGLVSGQPGKEVTPADLFGAEKALEERGPLAATIRDVAGQMVDPLILGAPLVGGVKRMLGAARTITPALVPPIPPVPPQPPVEHAAAGKWVIKPTVKEIATPGSGKWIMKPTTKEVYEPLPYTAQGPTGRFVQEPEAQLGTPAAEFKGPIEAPTSPAFSKKTVEGKVWEWQADPPAKQTVEGGIWEWEPDPTVTCFLLAVVFVLTHPSSRRCSQLGPPDSKFHPKPARRPVF